MTNQAESNSEEAAQVVRRNRWSNAYAYVSDDTCNCGDFFALDTDPQTYLIVRADAHKQLRADLMSGLARSGIKVLDVMFCPNRGSPALVLDVEDVIRGIDKASVELVKAYLAALGLGEPRTVMTTHRSVNRSMLTLTYPPVTYTTE